MFESAAPIFTRRRESCLKVYGYIPAKLAEFHLTGGDGAQLAWIAWSEIYGSSSAFHCEWFPGVTDGKAVCGVRL